MLSDRVRLDAFTEFVEANEANVRRALTAAFGTDVGMDATAEAFAYAWEHWDRVSGMENAPGYVYRVGFNHARTPSRRILVEQLEVQSRGMPWVEPGLPAALASLSEQQRVIVALVHSFEWSLSEVAALLEVSKGSVQSQLNRGLSKLRRKMGCPDGS
jgi:DNA-directed RNA polymerase specialized sigma24 family protein